MRLHKLRGEPVAEAHAALPTFEEGDAILAWGSKPLTFGHYIQGDQTFGASIMQGDDGTHYFWSRGDLLLLFAHPLTTLHRGGVQIHPARGEGGEGA